MYRRLFYGLRLIHLTGFVSWRCTLGSVSLHVSGKWVRLEVYHRVFSGGPRRERGREREKWRESEREVIIVSFSLDMSTQQGILLWVFAWKRCPFIETPATVTQSVWSCFVSDSVLGKCCHTPILTPSTQFYCYPACICTLTYYPACTCTLTFYPACTSTFTFYPTCTFTLTYYPGCSSTPRYYLKPVLPPDLIQLA